MTVKRATNYRPAVICDSCGAIYWEQPPACDCTITEITTFTAVRVVPEPGRTLPRIAHEDVGTPYNWRSR